MRYILLPRGNAKLDVAIVSLADPAEGMLEEPQAPLNHEGPTTLMLANSKVVTHIPPPEVGYRERGWPEDAVRVELTFDSAAIDQGDIVGDLEKALSRTALIHSCMDLKSPASCHVCSLLYRLKRLKVGPGEG